MLSPSNRFPLPHQAPTFSALNDPSNALTTSSTQTPYAENYDLTNNNTPTDNNLNHTNDNVTSSPEPLPELEDEFHVHEFALLHDLDWHNNRKESEQQFLQQQHLLPQEISSYLPYHPLNNSNSNFNHHDNRSEER